jgi:zinc transporter 2
MSGIACIGVLVNLALAWVLGADGHVHLPGAADHHGHCHSHDHHGFEEKEHEANGHGHSHSHDHVEEAGHNDHHDEQTGLLPDDAPSHCEYTVEHANEIPPPFVHEKRNVNLHAAYLHVLGDLAQSVAVLVAGIVIWLKPAWVIVDPLCTFGFCIIVFYSTLGVVRASIAVLLEEVPPQISWQAIYKDLTGIPHLHDVHDLHIWCISDGVPCLSMHANCDDGNCEAALKQITAICKKYGIEHVTAQVQPVTGACITCGHVVSSSCF